MTETESVKDLLKSLVECEDRKERKKLAKSIESIINSLPLTSNATPEAERVSEKPAKKEKKSKVADSKQKEGEIDEDMKGSKPSTANGDDKKKKSKKKAESEENAEEESKPNKQEQEVGTKHKRQRSAEETEDSTSLNKKSISEEPNAQDGDATNGGTASAKKRFQRVDEDSALQKALIADNRYEAVFGSGGYGAKANEKLKTVRGKDFRHEKTKKKRGSYRGGPIDEDVVNSVEFDSD